MKRRKRIEAWAIVDGKGRSNTLQSTRDGARKLMFLFLREGERLAHLVEHDPRADAVVGAAVAYKRKPCVGLVLRLMDAVERYEKGKKGSET